MILLSFFSVLFFLSFKLWCTMHVVVHVHVHVYVYKYMHCITLVCMYALNHTPLRTQPHLHVPIHKHVHSLPAGQNHTPSPSPLPSTTSTNPFSADPTSVDLSSADPGSAPSAPSFTDPFAKSEVHIEVQRTVHHEGIASPSFDLHPANDSRTPDSAPIPHNRVSTPPPFPLPAPHKPTDHPDSPVPYVAQATLHPTRHHLPAETALVAANISFKGTTNPYRRRSVFEGKPYWPGRMNYPLITATRMSRECHQATDDQHAAARLLYLQPNAPLEARENMRKTQQECHEKQNFPDTSFKGFPTNPNFASKTIVYSCSVCTSFQNYNISLVYTCTNPLLLYRSLHV